MPSFQISVTPSRRAAGRFVTQVRRAIQKALAEERKKSGITQSDIARAIGVHRSVINREIRGQKDLTLGRVAELAWALGRIPSFELREARIGDGTNMQHDVTICAISSSTGAAIPFDTGGMRVSTKAA